FEYKLKLDQTLLITLEDETRWAINNGLVERREMPDYLAYFDLEDLEAVKPRSVLLKR
ncbi:MAG: nitrate ABC transporter substrate-binding protein, partial [Magnetococcales bacterium]|nr:nitrate ABC transporter substrate-binding protein [Magnetococcales bacterium]